MRPRLRTASLVFVAVMATASTTSAQDAAGFSVTASIGGDIPLPELGGDAIYLSAGIGPGGAVKIGKAAPMMALVKEVWDARPQITIGGSYPLGNLPGLGKLAVSGVVSTAIEAPADQPRPMVGLAKLRLRF